MNSTSIVILIAIAVGFLVGLIEAIRKKYKEKPVPLFKTNDGVVMFVGDRYWYVARATGKKSVHIFSVIIMSEEDRPRGFAQFSTRELAQEYFDYYFADCSNGSI